MTTNQPNQFAPTPPFVVINGIVRLAAKAREAFARPRAPLAAKVARMQKGRWYINGNASAGVAHAARERQGRRTLASLYMLRTRRGPNADPVELGTVRPATRNDCPPRPAMCPWAGCKYHLALDVHPVTGSIQIHVPYTLDGDGVPDLDMRSMTHRCALDAAARGGHTLEDVGDALGLTRERARQIEASALAKARRRFDAGALETPPDRVGVWDLPEGYE